MSEIYEDDWAAFDAIDEDEALRNALEDPDAAPFRDGSIVEWAQEEGETVLERFRAALAREAKVDAESSETEYRPQFGCKM